MFYFKLTSSTLSFAFFRLPNVQKERGYFSYLTSCLCPPSSNQVINQVIHTNIESFFIVTHPLTHTIFILFHPHTTCTHTHVQQAQGFSCVMMSGSGTSIFAMGPPSPSPKDFDAEVFAKDMNVQVWSTHFTARPENDPKAWYPAPQQ